MLKIVDSGITEAHFENNNQGENMEHTEYNVVVETKDELKSIEDIKTIYHSFKNEDTKASSPLTDAYSLKGMDTINELVANAFLEIDELANKGKEEGFVKSSSNKVLAVIDPKSKWVGKWVGSKKDDLKRESLKQQSMKSIISDLIHNIETKRDETVSYVLKLETFRDYIQNRIKSYKELDNEITNLLDSELQTKDKFDAQKLSTSIKKTLINMEGDVRKQNNIITSASLTVTDIDNLLPDIEYDLNSLTAMKTPQQSLDDLHNIIANVQKLTRSFRGSVQDSVNDSIYKSLEMVTSSGIDIEDLKKAQEKEIIAQEKIMKLVNDSMRKVGTDLEGIKSIQSNMSQQRSRLENTILSTEKKQIRLGEMSC